MKAVIINYDKTPRVVLVLETTPEHLICLVQSLEHPLPGPKVYANMRNAETLEALSNAANDAGMLG